MRIFVVQFFIERRFFLDFDKQGIFRLICNLIRLFAISRLFCRIILECTALIFWFFLFLLEWEIDILRRRNLLFLHDYSFIFIQLTIKIYWSYWMMVFWKFPLKMAFMSLFMVIHKDDWEGKKTQKWTQFLKTD